MVWKSNLEHTTGLQQNCYARMAGSCDMTMAHLIYPARDIACFSGWSNMNMYLCVYIYIHPLQIRVLTCPRFTDCCVPKQLFTEINLQADMLVYIRGLPHIVEQLETVVYPC